MRVRVSSRLRKELADRGSRVSAAWSNEEMRVALRETATRDARKKDEKARAQKSARERREKDID
jgi:hypothetical protein